MWSEIINQLKEFVNMDAQKRAVLVSYGVLIFIIVVQYNLIQKHELKEEKTSDIVHEALKKNQDNCDDLLRYSRVKYQKELEVQKDKYQNVVDSLTNKVAMFQKQIQRDNLKLQKLL